MTTFSISVTRLAVVKGDQVSGLLVGHLILAHFINNGQRGIFAQHFGVTGVMDHRCSRIARSKIWQILVSRVGQCLFLVAEEQINQTFMTFFVKIGRRRNVRGESRRLRKCGKG